VALYAGRMQSSGMLYYCREGQTYSLLPQAPKSRMSTTEENNSEVCCETLTQENGVNS